MPRTLRVNISPQNNYQEQSMPLSPTFSVSSCFSTWLTEKPPVEIKSVLKSAFNSLNEKDRDLKLAAELGKTLLENNTMLEQKVSTLQIIEQENERKMKQFYESKLHSTEKSIQQLEFQHADLLKKYESNISFSEKANRQNTLAQQKLKTQTNELQQALEQAHEEIKDKEHQCHEYMQKLKTLSVVGAPSTIAKDTVKDDFEVPRHDNGYPIKQECLDRQSQYSKERLDMLEGKYQDQQRHLFELVEQLNEYKNQYYLIQKEDQGELVPSGPSSIFTQATTLQDLGEDCFENRNATTLFTELQCAPHWRDEAIVTMNIEKKNNATGYSRHEQALPCLKIDNSIIPSVYNRQNNCKVASSLSTSISKNQYQNRKGLMSHIVQVSYSIFYMSWRCLRFFIVIQLAMMIHVLSTNMKSKK